jgi:hypothetical protein
MYLVHIVGYPVAYINQKVKMAVLQERITKKKIRGTEWISQVQHEKNSEKYGKVRI